MRLYVESVWVNSTHHCSTSKLLKSQLKGKDIYMHSLIIGYTIIVMVNAILAILVHTIDVIASSANFFIRLPFRPPVTTSSMISNANNNCWTIIINIIEQ